MSIVIKRLEDLRQLEGWRIDKVTYEPPGLRLTLAHISAPFGLSILLSPTIAFALTGNLLTGQLGLNLNVDEVPGEPV